MHELSIMENALAVAFEQCRANGQVGQRIVRLDMAIGELTAVVPDSLHFAFEVLAKGTLAEGAELHIEHIPVACHCLSCKADFPAANFTYQCPDCGQVSTGIVKGQELHLVSIELA